MKQDTATIRRHSEAIQKDELHSAWLTLIRLCRELGHGEIERIRIQDGLPMMVEVTRQKIKLT